MAEAGRREFLYRKAISLLSKVFWIAYFMISFFLLIDVVTYLGRERNPPWHAYLAMDMDAWRQGFAICVINLLASSVGLWSTSRMRRPFLVSAMAWVL